jgi:hypothetical protein
MRSAERPVRGLHPFEAPARGYAGWLAPRCEGGVRDYADAVTVPGKRVAPPVVRGAGGIVAVQGAAALVVAVVLLVRGLIGADQHVVNGVGTAVWFVLVGGAVFAGGWALVAGKRWGRGLAVFTQLLLLPVAWYLGVGSHRLEFGIPLAAAALSVLILLFSPPAVRWAAGDQRGPASAANRGPDSR